MCTATAGPLQGSWDPFTVGCPCSLYPHAFAGSLAQLFAHTSPHHTLPQTQGPWGLFRKPGMTPAAHTWCSAAFPALLAQFETPLPPARRLGRGLFWEQLLRSNGLVRAMLTFPSQRRAGLRGGGAGPHTHGVEPRGPRQAAGIQAQRRGLSQGERETLPSLDMDWGPPPHPLPGTS